MLNKEQDEVVSAAGYFMPKGAWVAGGALTSVYTGQQINDVDLYFKDKPAFENAVRLAYDEGFWCVARSTRAVTFVHGTSVIQLMHFNWFDTPEAIFDSFDFTCVMAAMDCETKEIVMHDDFLKHASQRFLRFHAGTAYPYGTVARVLKYQKRGYTIGANEMLRIALKCSTVNISSWLELKEQIGGQYGEAVELSGVGDFSVDAAIEAMNSMEIRASGDQVMPGDADTLLQLVFEGTCNA